MNIGKMKLIYGGVILGSVLIIGFTLNYFYGQLGGYDVLEVYDLPSVNRVVVGKRITSRPTDPLFEKQYSRCRDLISDKEIRGDLTVITYYSDSLTDKKMDQFIGITLESDMAEVPQDFEILEMYTGPRLVVFLPMHPLVRPNPDKIESLIIAKAQEDSVDLLPFFYEFHFDDNSMIVEGWVNEPLLTDTLDSPLDSLIRN